MVTSAILIACEEGNLDALEQLVNIHRLDLNVTNAVCFVDTFNISICIQISIFNISGGD